MFNRCGRSTQNRAFPHWKRTTDVLRESSQRQNCAAQSQTHLMEQHPLSLRNPPKADTKIYERHPWRSKLEDVTRKSNLQCRLTRFEKQLGLSWSRVAFCSISGEQLARHQIRFTAHCLRPTCSVVIVRCKSWENFLLLRSASFTIQRCLTSTFSFTESFSFSHGIPDRFFQPKKERKNKIGNCEKWFFEFVFLQRTIRRRLRVGVS